MSETPDQSAEAAVAIATEAPTEAPTGASTETPAPALIQEEVVEAISAQSLNSILEKLEIQTFDIPESLGNISEELEGRHLKDICKRYTVFFKDGKMHVVETLTDQEAYGLLPRSTQAIVDKTFDGALSNRTTVMEILMHEAGFHRIPGLTKVKMEVEQFLEEAF